MIKKILILVILAGIAYAIYFAYGYIAERNVQMNMDTTPTNTAILADIEENIITTGIVEPLDSTEVRSEINGRILEIKVANGDNVKRGDVLIELDRVTLESELDTAKNECKLQELNVEQAQRDFNRQNELRELGFAIEKEYEDAKTTFEKNKIQLEVSNSALLKAEDNLSKTIIRAPQNGVITDMELSNGQVIVGAGSVSEGTLLMKVSDLDRLYVEAKINEVDVAKIDMKKITNVTFDSIEKIRLAGKVTEVSPYARQENNLRVFPVKVTFNSNGENIRPGISANIEFPISKVKDAVSVILSAVFIENDSTFAFVKDENGDWQRRDIITGISDIIRIEIKEGIKEGDVLATTFPRTMDRSEMQTKSSQKKKKK